MGAGAFSHRDKATWILISIRRWGFACVKPCLHPPIAWSLFKHRDSSPFTYQILRLFHAFKSLLKLCLALHMNQFNKCYKSNSTILYISYIACMPSCYSGPINNWLYGAEIFLRNQYLASYSRISQHCMEPEPSFTRNIFRPVLMWHIYNNLKTLNL
jgi:hypothetical protein